MAAREAKINKFLVDALIAKAKSPNLERFQGYSYNNYILKYAKRMLPHEFTKNLHQKDGVWDKESVLSFAKEIRDNSSKPLIAELLQDETSTVESDKFHEQLEKDAAVEQAEGIVKENKEEAKKEEKPNAAPHAVGTVEKKLAEEEAAVAEAENIVKAGQSKSAVAVAEKPTTPPSPPVITKDAAWMANLQKVPLVPPEDMSGGRSSPPKKPAEIKTTQPKPSFAVVGAQVVDLNGRPGGPGLSSAEMARLKALKESHPDIKARQLRMPHVEIPSAVKDASSLGQRGIRRLLYKIPLPTALGGVVGGLFGGVIGGPGGAILGAASGATASTYFMNQSEASRVDSAPTPEEEQQQSSSSGSRSGGRMSLPRRRLPKRATKKAGDAALKGLRGLAIKQGVKSLGVALFTTPVGWVILGIIAIFIILPIFMKLMENTTLLTTNFSSQTTTTPVSSDLMSCQFSGVSGDLKIGNPALASYISDVAAKVGIPASVLAGVIRIESPSALTSTDASFFTNDYDAVVSYAGAIGITQFLPGTFSGLFLAHKSELSSQYGKTSADTSIPAQVNPPPADSVMRITSIKDEILMTAFKIKDDKEFAVGSDGAWDEKAVRAVALAYQGGCDNNYCNDLAKSFTNCVPSGGGGGFIGADIASQLVSQLRQACGNPAYITSGNYTCDANAVPPISDVAKSFIKDSVISPGLQGVFQCVQFVQAVLGVRLPNVFYAHDLVGYSGLGYSYQTNNGANTAQVGDLAVWQRRDGHVGYVIRVFAGGFTVAQANYCPTACGLVDTKDFYYNDPVDPPTGWLRK